MFTDTVTIYAHRIVNNVETWERFVYHRCQVSETNVTTTDGEKQTNENEFRVTIPGMDMVVLERPLKGLDMLVVGECDKNISASYTLKDLINDYNAKPIYSQTNSTRRSLLKHWTVVAK